MDKTCRKILDKMISFGRGTNYVCTWGESFETFSDSLSIPREDIRAAIRHLEKNGWIEYQMSRSTSGTSHNFGFRLSHKGLNWRYFRRKEILNYIADKWIDFLAATISLISLIISVIALAHGQI